MLRIVSITAIAATLLFGGAGAPSAESARQISVTGEGQVALAPDMATLRFGVTEAHPEAQMAMRAVSDALERLLSRLADQGIAPADIQTSRLTLDPVWSDRKSSVGGSKPEISGFSANSMITVRVRDLEVLGGLLDQLLSDGANGFEGLRFGLQDPGPSRDEARRRAVADAMAKAALLAEAAGLPLGQVLSMSDTVATPQPRYAEMAAMHSGAVPVAAGEVTVSASVSMVFAIGD